MVLNSTKTQVLNENHSYSEHELNVLNNHEIGVHMVTTMNGLLHPLKIFSHGFPNYEETQEGLAVFAEYMSNNLTVKRLKVYCVNANFLYNINFSSSLGIVMIFMKVL